MALLSGIRRERALYERGERYIMAAVIIFSVMIVYVLIRTIAYGIYSIRETGTAGGISVFFLALCAVLVLYITLSGNKGIG